MTHSFYVKLATHKSIDNAQRAPSPEVPEIPPSYAEKLQALQTQRIENKRTWALYPQGNSKSGQVVQNQFSPALPPPNAVDTKC